MIHQFLSQVFPREWNTVSENLFMNVHNRNIDDGQKVQTIKMYVIN